MNENEFKGLQATYVVLFIITVVLGIIFMRGFPWYQKLLTSFTFMLAGMFVACCPKNKDEEIDE